MARSLFAVRLLARTFKRLAAVIAVDLNSHDSVLT
jgi:hypothetical protein